MRLFAFAALLAVGTTFAAPVALACDCAANPSDEEATKRADVAFIGEAISVGPAAPGNAELRVTRVIKGTPGATVTMVADLGNCSFVFTKGERYAVFAHATTGGLHASSCSGTHRIK